MKSKAMALFLVTTMILGTAACSSGGNSGKSDQGGQTASGDAHRFNLRLRIQPVMMTKIRRWMIQPAVRGKMLKSVYGWLVQVRRKLMQRTVNASIIIARLTQALGMNLPYSMVGLFYQVKYWSCGRRRPGCVYVEAARWAGDGPGLCGKSGCLYP